MQVLRAADNKVVPWRSGGGTSFEIAVWPPKSSSTEFDWRVTRALVERPGKFASFPGIDRSLTILSGKGLDLTVEGQTQIHLSAGISPFHFPGDIAIDSVPKDGVPVTDFNVMTRRGRFRSCVMRSRISTRTGMADIADVTLLFVEEGNLTIISGAKEFSLDAYDCALLDRAESAMVENTGGDAAVIIVDLRRC